MKLMSMSDSSITNDKEQLLYIFRAYSNTRPGQSNIFDNILRSYRGDLLENAGDVELQMDAIKSSLNTILNRYGYRNYTVSIVFKDTDLEFVIDITATTKAGNIIKLSETLIFEN